MLSRMLKFFGLTKKGLLKIILGCAIMAFAVVNVHKQSGVTEGGVLGMMLFLNKIFGFDQSITSVVLDVSCYVLGFSIMGFAYSIIGAKNPDRVQMIQFHQSYSYEDFIEGYRPTENGFTIKKGSFYKFCKLAEDDDENDYFFIIDEINRGNLSKIFGELFMLIEKDKRGIELQLLYSDENFSVPANVYIIGMMNTADRSLAMLDYALRRRFSFFTMKPGFNTPGFQVYQDSLKSDAFNKLIACVKQLNSKIVEDISLGEGFCIGHSYFCGLTPESANTQTLSSIVEYELIPLLKEYWFDEPEKIIDWSDRLRSTVK